MFREIGMRRERKKERKKKKKRFEVMALHQEGIVDDRDKIGLPK